MAKYPDRTAIIWERNDQTHEEISYRLVQFTAPPHSCMPNVELSMHEKQALEKITVASANFLTCPFAHIFHNHKCNCTILLLFHKHVLVTNYFHLEVKCSSLANSVRNLLEQTCQVANVLKNQCGVKKGDIVVIYMPTMPLAVASMLACARIGAVHRSAKVR